MPVIRLGPVMLKFGGTHEGAANLVPFRTILPYLVGESGWMIGGINLLGNILLLVPIGFLIPFLYRNITWKKSLAIAVAAGFVIEGMQVVLHAGIFDIDDVILNALGVMLGYWSFSVLSNWLRSKKYKTIAAAVIIVIAVGAAALYAIYPKGHRSVNAVRLGEHNRVDSLANQDPLIPEGADPCNGTGGTGHIVSVGNNTITMQGAKGTSQIIKLTDKTKIRSSAGPASKSDLKTGDGVTVVIDESETALLVLICNGKTLGQ